MDGFDPFYANDTLAVIPIYHNINDTKSTLPTTSCIQTTHIIWTLIDGGLMFIILSGNILTICAVKLSRKLSRSVANQFILNLALSDLYVGLTLPYHLTFYISDSLGQFKFTCLLRFVLISMACSASIINLLAIAVDRYTAIVYPLHYNRYMTKRTSSAVIWFGWCIAICIATLPVYWNHWDSTKQQECELHVIIPNSYVTLVMAPSFVAVWATLFLLYVRIWREAQDHVKRLRKTSYYQNGFHIKKDWKSIQVISVPKSIFNVPVFQKR